VSASRVAWRPGAASRRLAVLALARGGAALLGLAGVLVVAHALSAEELGRWSLALAIQGYALHLGEFGLRGVVTTEAARVGRRLPELLARYLRLRLTLSALALGAVLLGCALLRPADLLLVGLVGASILPIALQLDWLALVDDRNALAAALLLARPLAFLALLGLLPHEPGTAAIAGCFLAAWVLAAIVSWTSLDRPAGSGPGVVPIPAAMLRRGGSLAVVTLTNQAQLSADLLVVGLVLGAADAGDYYLAGQILVAALLFANAAGQIALARLPALAGEPERLRAVLGAEMARLLWFAVMAALVIAVAAPPIVPGLFGAEHAGAAEALLWLLPWFVLQHPTTLLQAALTAAGREDQVVCANGVAIAVLLPVLAMAALEPDLAGFAVARSGAEAARVAALLLSLRRGFARPAAAALGSR
jgi:lipopolysaccharide exporter